MKRIVLLIAIGLITNVLLAQSYEYRSAQNPYYWKNRTPNTTLN